MITRLTNSGFWSISQAYLIILLLTTNVTSYNHTSNQNYFNFPPLTDWIPVFRVRDTVNVSWSSEWTNRNINLWCGSGFQLIQTWTNLASVGFQLIQVEQKWLDPCHFDFFQVNVTTGKIILPDFNSGAFNVDTEEAATPTTWAANDINSACPTYYTSGSIVPTGPSSPTGSGAVNASSSSENCGSNKKAGGPGSNGGLSFGAGIGIGVAISIAVVAGSALIWWFGQRQKAKNLPPEIPGNRVQTMNLQNPSVSGYSSVQGRPLFKPYEGPASSGSPTELQAESARGELPT